MYSISEAFTAAASLLGLGAVRGGTPAGIPEPRSAAAPTPRPDAAVRPADPLAAGAPCFEAVAAALRDAGFLD